jgi:hypothetical protein
VQAGCMQLQWNLDRWISALIHDLAQLLDPFHPRLTSISLLQLTTV